MKMKRFVMLILTFFLILVAGVSYAQMLPRPGQLQIPPPSSERGLAGSPPPQVTSPAPYSGDHSAVAPGKGVYNPRNGEFYPRARGGVINPRTGAFYPRVDGGYLNPQTGELIPSGN
jgi:hypothetical protein